MSLVDWKITRKFHQKDISTCSFLITGGAGFIGSNLVQYLMDNGAKKVRVLDNLSNGYKENIEQYFADERFEFVEGDILDEATCIKVCEGIDYVSHQAALGSVPRSIKTPLATHAANATGFLNMLTAAKDNGVKTFVYASSSSVYGDSKKLPKFEDETGNPLSPYAVSKKVDELYARVFNDVYGFSTIGLRYFNIFGPKQSPNGPYAAVIPLYMDALLRNQSAKIFGDGEQSRDFTFVENAVQANVKAMLCENKEAFGEAFNIAFGDSTSVNELYASIKKSANATAEPEMCPPRVGDIRDSLADISKAKTLMGYNPEVGIDEGIAITLDWFNHKFVQA
jgi:UDP-N-acetylglucosamine 4-epimerase